MQQEVEPAFKKLHTISSDTTPCGEWIHPFQDNKKKITKWLGTKGIDCFGPYSKFIVYVIFKKILNQSRYVNVCMLRIKQGMTEADWDANRSEKHIDFSRKGQEQEEASKVFSSVRSSPLLLAWRTNMQWTFTKACRHIPIRTSQVEMQASRKQGWTSRKVILPFGIGACSIGPASQTFLQKHHAIPLTG